MLTDFPDTLTIVCFYTLFFLARLKLGARQKSIMKVKASDRKVLSLKVYPCLWSRFLCFTICKTKIQPQWQLDENYDRRESHWAETGANSFPLQLSSAGSSWERSCRQTVLHIWCTVLNKANCFLCAGAKIAAEALGKTILERSELRFRGIITMKPQNGYLSAEATERRKRHCDSTW